MISRGLGALSRRLPRPLAIPLRMLWRNRDLVMALTRRGIAARYRGSLLGLAWLLLAPVLMLLVYSFVFGIVFDVRWGGVGENRLMFAAVLFCGISIFSLFSEVFTRSSALVIENPNYVKKIVFPTETLGCALVLGASLNFLVALGVLLLFVFFSTGALPLSVLALPLLLIPFQLGLVGLSWVLAALGVYLRDIVQLTGLLVTILMFLSPIFYPMTAVPESYRPLLWLNPMTHVVEAMRAILIHGEFPEWWQLALWWGIALATLALGHAFFRRLRPGFADVL